MNTSRTINCPEDSNSAGVYAKGLDFRRRCGLENVREKYAIESSGSASREKCAPTTCTRLPSRLPRQPVAPKGAREADANRQAAWEMLLIIMMEFFFNISVRYQRRRGRKLRKIGSEVV